LQAWRSSLIPLSGIDQGADDEINTCDGRHKGRMRAKNHRSNRRSSPPKPCDITLDFQQFPCKQVGTGAVYGMVSVLLYSNFPMYTAIGASHDTDAFSTAFGKTRCQLAARARKRARGLDASFPLSAPQVLR
jgi:hypothetical protein